MEKPFSSFHICVTEIQINLWFERTKQFTNKCYICTPAIAQFNENVLSKTKQTE